ncbi:MAG TPA: hypothetical protein VFJ98_05645 [Mycobacteriales bacterium]|nr:hypothetical protein [Mycobacteriales bacterium]
MRWRAQLRRAVLLLGGVALPVGWLLAMPAAATTPTHLPDSAAPHSATVGDLAEAWYAASPVDICTTPLGCPPDQAPTSPYPADTLHVGVAGGQETARTYLLPDLSLVPPGDRVLSAVMTVPVATGAADGTQSPDTAHVVACLVTGPFADGQQGSTETPPKADCSTAAKASYDAKKSTLTIDLGSIAAAWASGVPPLGVALVPDATATQPTDAWHVAINGRKRQGTPHVQTVVTYAVGAGIPATGVATGPAGPASTSAGAPAAPAASAAPPALPPAATSTQPAAPPVVAGSRPAATGQQQAAAFVTGVPQPLAFILPLVLLAGASFFARVFTRDATPRAAGS